MGEGLGRWKVAAYGVSLGIDFANLDWQKTAKSGLSRPGHYGQKRTLSNTIWVPELKHCVRMSSGYAIKL